MKSYDEIAKIALDRRDEYLAEQSKKAKAAKRVAASVVCVGVVFALSFGVWKSGFFSFDPSNITGESDTQSDTALPTEEQTTEEEKPLPHGGDRGGYNYAYHYKLHGIDGRLIDFVEESRGVDTHDWFAARDAALKALKYRGGEPGTTPSLIKFLRDFEITREEFEEYNNEMIEFYTLNDWDDMIAENAFTKEEIDAIFSDDTAEWVRVFANEYAIVKNGEAFSPDWYVFASEEELAEYSITVEEVDRAVDKLATLSAMCDYAEYYYKKRGISFITEAENTVTHADGSYSIVL